MSYLCILDEANPIKHSWCLWSKVLTLRSASACRYRELLMKDFSFFSLNYAKITVFSTFAVVGFLGFVVLRCLPSPICRDLPSLLPQRSSRGIVLACFSDFCVSIKIFPIRCVWLWLICRWVLPEMKFFSMLQNIFIVFFVVRFTVSLPTSLYSCSKWHFPIVHFFFL